jgi:hypothetical protein
LKGLSEEESTTQIEFILERVNLVEVADNRGFYLFFSFLLLNSSGWSDCYLPSVSSYSGGMKRRLSIGISTIGNPTLIFMDVCGFFFFAIV